MKKILVTLLALCFFTFANAQNLSNGGFEEWTNDTIATGWTSTFNASTVIDYMGFPVPVTINYSSAHMVTEAHLGSYAMRIQGQTLLSGMMQVPGVCHLGVFDTEAILNTDFDNFDASSFNLTDYIHGGIEFAQIPTSVSAWIKYYPTGDTMQMTIIATRWNNGTREIVARGDYSTSETITDFTLIDIPIDTLIDNATPDTLNIIFTTAQSSECNPESDLIIDDIQLNFENGITYLNLNPFTVTPNPTTDFIQIHPAVENVPYQVQLFDVNGKIVWENQSLINDTQIDVQRFTQGVYFLQTQQNGKSSSHKIVINN